MQNIHCIGHLEDIASASLPAGERFTAHVLRLLLSAGHEQGIEGGRLL